MPLLASAVSGPISKPCPACISKVYISCCCIIDIVVLQLFCTMLNKNSLYISFVKYSFLHVIDKLCTLVCFLVNFFLCIHVTDKL